MASTGRRAEHGSRSRYTTGCRCAACREANRAYVEQWRRATGVQPLRTGPQTGHGTPSRYYHWGCRCAECRAALAERRRADRANAAARLTAGEVTVPHGTESTYNNWGCRCEECGAAKRRANARVRARRNTA